MNASVDKTIVMKFFLLFAAVGSAAATIEGPSESDPTVVAANHLVRLRGSDTSVRQSRMSRRLRVRDQSCTLYKIDADLHMLDDSDSDSHNDNDNNDSTQWACEFDRDYAQEVLGLNDPLVDLVGFTEDDIEDIFNTPSDSLYAGLDEPGFDETDGVESGKTVILFPDGVVDRVNNTMIVRTPSVVTEDDVNERRLTGAPPTIEPRVGPKKTLVVRMFFEGKTNGPGVSQADLYKSMYENPVSLKKKYEACSYNQLKIEPYTGSTQRKVNVYNGIVDVTFPSVTGDELQNDIKRLNGNVNKSKLIRFTREAATEMLGNLPDQFDFVLFCMPEEVKGFLALAILNRWDSYYTSPWCTRPSFALHEVGHTMGLEHAGELQVYDDKVGYMGYSYNNVAGPNMCFNPSNNYYLGWYQQQSEWYNPLESNKGKRFVLNGIDDYDPTSSAVLLGGKEETKRLVVLQLFQTDLASDFYLGYNKATGINSETYENKGELLIVERKGAANKSAPTKKIGTLKNAGDTYEIENFNGQEGTSVLIKLITISADQRDVVIKINSVKKSELQFKGDPAKNCQWVKKKATKRCFLRWRGESINEFWCPDVCANVQPQEQPKGNDCSDPATSVDRDNFQYKGKPEKNCEWVGDDTERLCKRKYKGRRIDNFWCPVTCGIC